VELALKVVKLDDRMHQYPKQLSGGQEHGPIARAIVSDPTLLIADEPTGDLDKVSPRNIETFLCSLTPSSENDS